MLELTEDEQQIFIEKIKQKVLAGKTPAKGQPTLTIIIGTPGSGKSYLAQTIENSVYCSPDDIIAEYIKTTGTDPRGDFLNDDIEKFTARVYDEVVQAIIDGKYNFTCDSFKDVDGQKVVNFMAQYGYKKDIKVILADEYQAALNAVERKLDYDDKYTEYCKNKQSGTQYPRGNPLEVAPDVSTKTSDHIAKFICKAVEEGKQIEIYEFGKIKPSFRTGDDFDKFLENLPLTPITKHIKRCQQLYNRAHQSGNKKCAAQLNWLMQKMKKDTR